MLTAGVLKFTKSVKILEKNPFKKERKTTTG